MKQIVNVKKKYIFIVWLAIFQHNFSIYLCTFFQLMSPCLETIEIELLSLIFRTQVKTGN